MTGSQITGIINSLPNKKYLYGFRLSSGKEVILAKVNSSQEALDNANDDELNPDNYVIDGDMIKVEGRVSSTIGQSKVCRFISASDVVEVLVFYDSKINGKLEDFASGE